jgi:hypothetical protein
MQLCTALRNTLWALSHIALPHRILPEDARGRGRGGRWRQVLISCPTLLVQITHLCGSRWTRTAWHHSRAFPQGRGGFQKLPEACSPEASRPSSLLCGKVQLPCMCVNKCTQHLERINRTIFSSERGTNAMFVVSAVPVPYFHLPNRVCLSSDITFQMH